MEFNVLNCGAQINLSCLALFGTDKSNTKTMMVSSIIAVMNAFILRKNLSTSFIRVIIFLQFCESKYLRSNTDVGQKQPLVKH